MKKVVKIVVFGILLILLSVTVHSYYYYLILPQKQYDAAQNQAPFDVIIVPGIPYDKGNWSMFLKWRIHWSVLLYRQGLTKNIIYSGAAVHTPYVESTIMKLFAEQLHVSPQHIFTETRAEHSTENLYYSYLLAREKGFSKIALATDPFQTFKLAGYIKEYGLNISVIPIVYTIADTIHMLQPEIDTKKAYIEDFVALNEREDFMERMNNSNGKKIDWNNINHQ